VPERSPAIEQVLTSLAETPPRIAELTDGLSPVHVHTPPAQDAWSVNDVLAHLRACADVWGKCIAAIIAEDGPALRAVSPRTWLKRTNYLELEFLPSLHTFATQRTALLAVLERLPPEGWSRAATVRRAGKVLEQTVLSYAQWLTDHERPHVEQIECITRTLPR
jgi:hypothetical protein